jgi:CHAT domain-containing protein/tetratricopeptide (TPR) repeat protein
MHVNGLIRRSAPWLFAALAVAAGSGPASGQTEDEVRRALEPVSRLRVGGRFEQAVAEAERSVRAFEGRYGRGNAGTMTLVNELGLCHFEAGNLAQAELLFLEARDRNEKLFGADSVAVGGACNNLGLIYQERGQLDKALGQFLRAEAICLGSREFGENHPNTAQVRSNLGLIYRLLGQPAKGAPLSRKALAAQRAALPPGHPNLIRTMNYLALQLADMRQAEAAEPLFREALGLCEEKLPLDHPVAVMTLNNAALFYADNNQPAKAGELYRRALELSLKRNGENHLTTAKCLTNLGDHYLGLREYDKAEPALRRAVAVFEAKAGADHPDTAAALRKLAALHRAAGRPEQAEPLYTRALEIYRARLGKDHPTTAAAAAQYAGLLAGRGRAADAARTLDRALRGLRRYTAEVLPALADGAQMGFLARDYDPHLRLGLALALAHPLGDENRLRLASWLLNGKGVATEALAERAALARDADSPAARKTLAELEDVRRQMARLTNANSEREDSARFTELKDREKRLAASLAGFDTRQKRDDPWYDIDDLRQRLPEAAVFIDLARAPARDLRSGKDGPAHYLAVLTFRSADTQVVDLGDAGRIDDAVQDVREQFGYAAGAVRDRGERPAERAVKEPLAALSRLILDPLRGHIGPKEQWVVSPDGALWLVPWAALPLDAQTYAVERHRISYVVSGRDLLLSPLRLDRKATEPLVVADPDFDLGVPGAPPGGGRGEPAPAAGRGLSRDFKLGPVPRLPGTAAEAEAIVPDLEKLAGARPRVLTDKQATAAAVRAARGPRVLVLSTHGFFLEAERAAGAGGAGAARENPLLRCGLLLAGCNRLADGRPGGETGVLTGLEVVGCDLRGTGLVVLSACETGLGDVRTGEGVAGLRQAFQIAGAESVVASLWKVPDRSTARLMAEFFRNLAAGRGRADALRDAQLAVIRERREQSNAAHPYFWAAFTLTGRE